MSRLPNDTGGCLAPILWWGGLILIGTLLNTHCPNEPVRNVGTWEADDYTDDGKIDEDDFEYWEENMTDKEKNSILYGDD